MNSFKLVLLLITLSVSGIAIVTGCNSKTDDNSNNAVTNAVKNTVEDMSDTGNLSKKATLNNEVCRPELSKLPPSGEGMWPWDHINKLNEDDLKSRGLKVALKDLWTKNKGGLFSAAVGLKGCSASFVSNSGLLITNHHCAFRAIQRNSTDDNNLLENGFIANSKEEELDGHGLRVFVFKKQTDVTPLILDELPKDISDLERMQFIETKEKVIVKKCEEQSNTRCLVSRNNNGLGFILIEKMEIRDVRLVAAPPRSLGEFGGEVDNWQWPRHTMDFSFLRAYVDKDGKSAEYSKDNVPLKSKTYFKVSAKGVDPGDLVMVVGTPYRTARYRTKASVSEDLNWYYPLRDDLFTNWIELLEQTCKEVPDSCLPSSSMKKSINNALTNARGMVAGLKRSSILQRKEKEEKQWTNWVNSDLERKEKWGNALFELVEYFETNKVGRDRDFLIRYLMYGSKMMSFARKLTKWEAQQSKPDALREPGYQNRDEADILDNLKQAQRSLHIETDKRLFAMFLTRFGNLPKEEHLKVFDDALNGNYSEQSIKTYIDKLYKQTKLDNVEFRADLFKACRKNADNSNVKLKNSLDSFIKLGIAISSELNDYDNRKKQRAGALSRLRPVYLESLIAMRGKLFYPDANASPRVSFATVAGYSPRDGQWQTPLTTMSGLLAKVTDEKPFDAPKNVIEAIKNKKFGKYKDSKLQDVPVCFLSNADTTGGNSGSPALDANGQFVGLNFDRVYENISGDYGYNPSISRNVMVEIRSILWYLDEVLNAKHILDELGLQ